MAAWIGAAYWFTASTSFANPAITIGRAFTDTFAGIRPIDAPGFIVAQVIGALGALYLGKLAGDPGTAGPHLLRACNGSVALGA